MFDYHDVARVMDIDFIYFDLILAAIWITLLLVRKRFKALLFGLFGYAVVFFTDDVIWYTIQGTRHIEGPIGPHLFLTYFSFTYGMIMFSYAPMMFDKNISKIEKGLFSALLWGGWMLIAAMSQWIHWNDAEMVIYREMSGSRIGQILMIAVGYGMLLVLKAFRWKFMENVPWWYFAFLFGVGIFIHFSMESTLMIAEIRPLNWSVMIFNSLLEFNTGIPYLFLMWIFVNLKEYKVTKDLVIETAEEDAQVNLGSIKQQ